MTIEFDSDAVVNRVNNDPEFRLRAHDWTSTVRLEMGDAAWDAEIVNGELVSFAPPAGRDVNVKISGPESAWRELLASVPTPMYTDIRMAGRVGITLTGDVVRDLGPYGPALQRLVKLLRELTSGVEEVWPEGYPFKDTDVAVGRYVYITVEGVEYRVYYEEAGQGVPLLLQHTAGADSRQWRHLLADPDLQKKFRLIAYDLPYHGDSLPPTAGVRWWQQQYDPTKEYLMRFVVNFAQGLQLEQPVFMGCSVGGQLALDLAAHYPDEFRAFISINGTYGGLDRSLLEQPGQLFFNDYNNHPRIYKDYFGAMMYGITTPFAPEPFRRDLTWIYASSGPAVYRGDNIYHIFGHDLREDGHLIDASRKPVYVLVGEYDPTLDIPGGTREIPEHIPNVRFQVLAGLSHFMMADDPVRFREAIIPILDEALELTVSSAEKAEVAR